MSPDPASPHQHSVRLAAQRLDEAIAQLESGQEVQPGKLIALTLLTFNKHRPGEQGYVAWRDFILRDTIRRLRSGESLAQTHALPVEEKCALLETARQYLVPEYFIHSIQDFPELARIRAYLNERFPHWTRRHVHGTRWKVLDPDVLLIRDACWHRHAWRDMLTDYCIEYSDYRLMLTPRSIPRVETLRGKLHETFFAADRA